MTRNKSKSREKAAKLRKQGFSYSEIKRVEPVSKSTLSLWLRNIKLTPKQKERLKNKQRKSQNNVTKFNTKKRIAKTKKIKTQAKKEVGKISKREMWLIGISLYWAEGFKQKKHNTGQRAEFCNSDPKMIKTYLKWLKNNLSIKNEEIIFSIYSHTNIKQKEKEIKNYWSKTTGFEENKFNRVYYKPNKDNKYRKNQGRNYNGLLRITVRKSTDLNRKISGWIEGIHKQCGVV